MGRKNYLVEKLTKEEKLYLKRIVLTAKNKYIGKNYNYINSRNVSIDKIEISSGDSIVDEIMKMNEENMKSEEKLHEIFSDPKLYKMIKALPFDEKRVLFYLLIKNKTMIEISDYIKASERNIRRIKKKIFNEIYNNSNKGENENV